LKFIKRETPTLQKHNLSYLFLSNFWVSMFGYSIQAATFIPHRSFGRRRHTYIHLGCKHRIKNDSKGYIKMTQKNSIRNVPFKNDFLFANKSIVTKKKWIEVNALGAKFNIMILWR
jgi:hypothetical protein